MSQHDLLHRRTASVKWHHVAFHLYQAQSILSNFTFTITIAKTQPTYGEIRFTHQDLTKYTTLKKYAGDYGFVVPIRGRRNNKILRGEKKMKYKGMEKGLQNDT